MPEAKSVPKRPNRKAAAKAEADASAKITRAALLLKQAAEPTRLRVMLILAEKPSIVGGLGDALGMSQPAVSHHLALLRHGGLITFDREGRTNVYRLTDRGRALAEVVAPIAG